MVVTIILKYLFFIDIGKLRCRSYQNVATYFFVQYCYYDIIKHIYCLLLLFAIVVNVHVVSKCVQVVRY